MNHRVTVHSARATRVRGSTVQVTEGLNLSRPSLLAQHASRGSEGTVTRVRSTRLPESPDEGTEGVQLGAR